MKDLWLSAHEFIISSKVGDYYEVGNNKVVITKRTSNRVYFSNGNIVTIKSSQYGFKYLVGKNVMNILRDIEGYMVYKIHC
jgi:hypothetical protein